MIVVITESPIKVEIKSSLNFIQNSDFWKTPFYPFCVVQNLKWIWGWEKSKVVDLVMLYNFVFWSFQSFSIKCGVILKRFKSQICPLFIPYSNFKMESKFGNSLKSKVVDLSKMKNFGVLSFWSFNIKFKVILDLPKSKKCPLLISNSNFKI
jgi:hypothetical protein